MRNPNVLIELPVSSDGLVRVDPDADLWTIAATLAGSDVGAVVVGAEDEVAGVVSERDIVRALAERRDPSATTAADIAHTELVCCDANCTVGEVAEEMMERYVRHVLVEEDGRVVGVVSARDLLGAYAAADVDVDIDVGEPG